MSGRRRRQLLARLVGDAVGLEQQVAQLFWKGLPEGRMKFPQLLV
ncbi:hypothetical protein ACTU45_19610 [Streptomyces sp. 24-1644]